MHRVKPLLGVLLVAVLCIGIFPSRLNAMEEEPDMEDVAKRHMVFVEPTGLQTSVTTGESALLPYRERRPRWGTSVGVNYNSYEPTNYQPSLTPTATYRQAYKAATAPLTELTVSVKRNLLFGSVGGEVGAGIFQNSNVPTDATGAPVFGASSLNLEIVRFGGVLNFDNLMQEPYVVPYISGGGYIVLYKESLAGNSFNGNTQPALYGSFGLAFQLDWMDRKAARSGYVESGTESCYLFTEGRKFFASNAKKDPDFSNDLAWAVGLKIEF